MQDEIKLISVKLLFPSKLNPRQAIDTEGLQELANNIREVGIVQPLLVRPVSEGYDVVIGE